MVSVPALHQSYLHLLALLPLVIGAPLKYHYRSTLPDSRATGLPRALIESDGHRTSDDGGNVSPEAYAQFSHLSPLITYHPPSAWHLTPDGAFSDVPGARAEFSTGLAVPYKDDERKPDLSMKVLGSVAGTGPVGSDRRSTVTYVSGSSRVSAQGGDGDEWHIIPAKKATLNGRDAPWLVGLPVANGETAKGERPVDIQGDEEEGWGMVETPAEAATMSISGARSYLNLDDQSYSVDPEDDMRGSYFASVVSEPMVHINSELNLGFTPSARGHWVVSNPAGPFDNVTRVPLSGAESIPSSAAFPTGSVISTSTHLASLTYDMMAAYSSEETGTAVVYLYGSVGPDFGRVRLTFVPDSASLFASGPKQAILAIDDEEGEDVFSIHDPRTNPTVLIDTERPVAASGQLLGVVHLDMREQYMLTITHEDKRPGKRIELAGMVVMKYHMRDRDMDGDGLLESDVFTWSDWLEELQLEEMDEDVLLYDRPGPKVTSGYRLNARTVSRRRMDSWIKYAGPLACLYLIFELLAAFVRRVRGRHGELHCLCGRQCRHYPHQRAQGCDSRIEDLNDAGKGGVSSAKASSPLTLRISIPSFTPPPPYRMLENCSPVLSPKRA